MKVLEAAAHMKHPDNRRLIDSRRPGGRLLAYRRRTTTDSGMRPSNTPRTAAHSPACRTCFGLAASQRIDPMDLAFWLYSPSGSLEGAARRVDLLRSRPNAVIGAARHDLPGDVR